MFLWSCEQLFIDALESSEAIVATLSDLTLNGNGSNAMQLCFWAYNADTLTDYIYIIILNRSCVTFIYHSNITIYLQV